MVPQVVTFGPSLSWGAPSSFPPSPPDLLGAEQTPSVGGGLAALGADESAAWAWLPPNTVLWAVCLGCEKEGTVSLKVFPFLLCLCFGSCLPQVLLQRPVTSPILFSQPPGRAELNGLFLKPRTHVLSGSSSFPCSCETPHSRGQMPWQLEHRASRYRLRALVPTPNIRLCMPWPGGLFAWLLCQAPLLPPVLAGSCPSTGWQAPW